MIEDDISIDHKDKEITSEVIFATYASDEMEDFYWHNKRKIYRLLNHFPQYILNYCIMADGVEFSLIPNKLEKNKLETLRSIFSDFHKKFCDLENKIKPCVSAPIDFKGYKFIGYIERTRKVYYPRERFWFIERPGLYRRKSSRPRTFT